VIVISDTSCLCYLARIGKEGVLQHLYGEVYIPPAVAAELADGAATLPEIHRVLDAPWLVVRTLNSPGAVLELMNEIDRGEAEAITLYEELHADLLMVDDLKARTAASRRNIKQIGLLGCLFAAKKANLLGGPLRRDFESLLSLGFRASPPLVEAILKEAGE
jgi:predicted nucleic acid-binding protein